MVIFQYNQYRDCKAIKMAHYCSANFLMKEWKRQETKEYKEEQKMKKIQRIRI